MEFNKGKQFDSKKPVSYRFSDVVAVKTKTPAEARV
jgi:hypothetical protein